MIVALFCLALTAHILGWYTFCSLPLIILALWQRHLNRSWGLVLGVILLLVDINLHSNRLIWIACYALIATVFLARQWLPLTVGIMTIQAIYIVTLTSDLIKVGAWRLIAIRTSVALALAFIGLVLRSATKETDDII